MTDLNDVRQLGSGRTFLESIPVKDPGAALRFCQALVSLIETTESQSGRTATSQQTTPELSIVIPIYNEEENLPTLHERLTAAMIAQGDEYEIIYVDDGSHDRSPSLLERYAAEDNHVVVVDLARNFGHQAAISAGLEHSRGHAVIIMDGDLQDPPEVLHQFIAKWRDGFDVVYAIREKRKEIWFKRWAYAAFYRVLQWMAHIDMPLDAGDFCIMDRRVVDLLIAMPERSRFVRGIRSWLGFKQVGLAYERSARHAGASKYTFRRLVYLAVDGMVAFSYTPLRITVLAGFGISLLSLTMAVYYVVKKIFYTLNPPGFATLIVATLFLAGMQLITIGVMGEYIARISEEVKRRPIYVARRIIRRGSPSAS
ncbi:MAG: glycosyltransferase family 2 protein [Candidatus Hydrogenedentes bacterium]|nr:glycosyltransferase family 2 protein [Candidatus Hydrogenedentota bacterium]